MKIISSIICLFACLLSSCVAVIAAGAAAGLVVYDKRNISMIEQDARIFYVLRKDIVQDPQFQDASVTVTSFNRVVLLTGQVPNATLRVISEKKARKTPNVYRVYNEIEVGSPLSYTQHSKDAWINSEIRAKLLKKSGLESGSIRVVTDNAVVYLMGKVSYEQADTAVDVARRVNGVEKVVKVFMYNPAA